MKQLTYLRGGSQVTAWLLDLPDVVIGRGSTAQIRMDGNPLVSRQHCVVRQGPRDTHVVEDLGGANGTWINGERVEEQRRLRPGDRIVLGEDVLRYDFATRLAVSLRQAFPDATAGTGEVEELPTEAFDGVDGLADLSDIREHNRHRRESGPIPRPRTGDRGEHTTVADRDDLERQLAELMIKARPHLLVRVDEGQEQAIPLDRSPVSIGWLDRCHVRLPGSRWLPGRVPAQLTSEAGTWCVVPQSTFWSPVYLGDVKLTKLRQLADGEVLEIGGVEIEFRRGE